MLHRVIAVAARLFRCDQIADPVRQFTARQPRGRGRTDQHHIAGQTPRPLQCPQPHQIPDRGQTDFGLRPPTNRLATVVGDAAADGLGAIFTIATRPCRIYAHPAIDNASAGASSGAAITSPNRKAIGYICLKSIMAGLSVL
jgi:hypothetical protein